MKHLEARRKWLLSARPREQDISRECTAISCDHHGLPWRQESRIPSEDPSPCKSAVRNCVFWLSDPALHLEAGVSLLETAFTTGECTDSQIPVFIRTIGRIIPPRTSSNTSYSCSTAYPSSSTKHKLRLSQFHPHCALGRSSNAIDSLPIRLSVVRRPLYPAQILCDAFLDALSNGLSIAPRRHCAY